MLSAGTLPGRILFIGNSYTLYNGGLDAHVRGLFAASGRGDTCATVRKVQGGATLSSHWHTYRSQSAVDSTVDAVILQGYLQHRAGIDSFRAAVKLFCAFAGSAGVRPVLLANWANPFGTADMYNSDIAYEYEAAGRAAGAEVVHAGTAFRMYKPANPDSVLLSDGIAHPSPSGTYLAAACIYAALAGESPAGIVYDGGLAGVTGWHRTYLQQLAWHVVGGGPPALVSAASAGSDAEARVWCRNGVLHAAVPDGSLLRAFDVSGSALLPGPRAGTWYCSGPGIYFVGFFSGRSVSVLLPLSVPASRY